MSNSHSVEKNDDNTLGSMLSVGGCPWRRLFIGGFVGVFLWPYIYISRLEHCNYNTEILAFIGYFLRGTRVRGRCQ